MEINLRNIPFPLMAVSHSVLLQLKNGILSFLVVVFLVMGQMYMVQCQNIMDKEIE